MLYTIKKEKGSENDKYLLNISFEFLDNGGIMCLTLLMKRGLPVTQMDILRKIVEAENNARSIYTDAVSLQTDFESYMKERTDKLRRLRFDEAEGEIARVQQEETAQADKEIAEMEKTLQVELEAAGRLFARQSRQVTDRIFKLAVDTDA